MIVAPQKISPPTLSSAPKAEDKKGREVTQLEKDFKEFCKLLGKKTNSFSKLNSLEGCMYSFYMTYIKGIRGKDNVYSFIGSAVHDALEDYTNGKCTNQDLVNRFNEAMTRCEKVGLYFPSDGIKSSYNRNVTTCLERYETPFGECEEIKTEEFVCGLMGNEKDIPMIGYIDILCIKRDSDGTKYAEIYDFKTSSKYSKDKLKEYGRQLLVYKLMIERFYGIEVRKLGWVMCKYVEVDGVRKGSRKVVEWKDLDGHTNPKQYIKFYDYTMEDVDEVDEWIDNKAKQIELIMNKSECDMKPINFKKEGTFFCTNLCGHSVNCKHFKKYQESQSGGFSGY